MATTIALTSGNKVKVEPETFILEQPLDRVCQQTHLCWGQAIIIQLIQSAVQIYSTTKNHT